MTPLTFEQCVMSPQWGCTSLPEFTAPFVLTAILVFAGVWSAWYDRRGFRRTCKRGVIASLALVASSAVPLVWFYVFDRGSIEGIETSPAAQATWVAAATAFGAGLFLSLGTLAFALGGVLAKLIWGKEHYRSMGQRLVIAIDGPAASGKGTLAKKIAAHFNLPCLDTGLLYRAVARDVVVRGGVLDDAAAAVVAAKSLDAATLDDANLRGRAAGDAASIVAKIPDVRAALLQYQRAFAKQPGGAVLDGRDIGTVVCPDADVKIYVTASAEERARRRHLEHESRGEAIAYETVLDDIRRRDARDSGRDIAPMGAAADAITLDTTTLDADAAFAAALKVIADKR